MRKYIAICYNANNTTTAEWKASSRKRALLINGARQVGKATTIRMFASTHYKHFVEINSVKHPSAKKAFDNSLDTRSIVLNLSALGFGPFVKGETLVFFDEIQECPNARTAIKFLVEDGDYDYIESGSLLGIKYKEISSYPVGFEEEIRLFPLDFEEFLWAKDISGDVIDYLRQCYDKQVPVSPIIHEQVSRCQLVVAARLASLPIKAHISCYRATSSCFND